MDRRLITTIVVISVIYLGWMFARRMLLPPPEEPVKVAAADARADAAATDAGAGAAVAAPGPAEAVPVAPEPDQAEETVEYETPALTLVFTTRGGALKQARLKGDKYRRHPSEGGAQVDLVRAKRDQPLPLALEWTAAGGPTVLGPNAIWRVGERGADGIVFLRDKGDLSIRKEFLLPKEGYRLGLTVTVRNRGAAPVQGTLGIGYPGFDDPAHRKSGGMFSPPPDRIQAICRSGGKTQRVAVEDKAVKKPGEGLLRYAGVEERYFIGAIAPVPARQGAACAIGGSPPDLLASEVGADLRIDPGAEHKLEFAVYLGPKDAQRLAAVGAELETAIDFGFWEILAKLLLEIMKWFHGLVPNWGISIILLTLLVKVLTFPLAHKSMKSGEEMKRLAPKLEELKKKYGADQQRMGAETMKLYKEHNVNPFGGCLPMLIQMPIWIALYTTLYTAVEIYNEPFLRGWIEDLTAKDPFYALPLAMGATMLVTQVLTPMPQQQQSMKLMMYGLPVMFTFFMLGLPSGLVLYIFTSNVLSIAQQLWFRKMIAPRMAAA